MKNLQQLIPVNALDAGGRCGSQKGSVIMELVQKTNASLCVEIGVFKGSSLMYFIEALMKTNGFVIGIDPYYIPAFTNHILDTYTRDIIYNVLFKEQTTLDKIHTDLIEIIKSTKLDKYAKVIKTTSENASSEFQPNSIDVLHIDGNHDEEFVTKDILLYLPLVKENGYIIMDDITWEGVKKSIQAHLILKCKLIKEFADFAVYQKIDV